MRIINYYAVKVALKLKFRGWIETEV